MALILVGQNELWDQKLRFKKYAAIQQRIDMSCVLPHLDEAQTQMYINTHLHYAGVDNDLFTAKAVEEIHKASTGIPRKINKICDKCLTYASQQNQRLVDEHMVLHVNQHEMLNFGESHE
jgi:general secretion pathway protein A